MHEYWAVGKLETRMSYPIKGVTMNGVLEVDEISAPPQLASTASRDGIVLPLARMLPSTMELYRPTLRKEGFVK